MRDVDAHGGQQQVVAKALAVHEDRQVAAVVQAALALRGERRLRRRDPAPADAARRTPLYRVAEFYEDTATGVLFGNDILPEHLTDDALARALDKLAEGGPRGVYSTVALRACMFEGIDRQFGHFDTTSILLFGEYPGLRPEDLQLVRGYSQYRSDMARGIAGGRDHEQRAQKRAKVGRGGV
jgi:hypothetical protein